MWWKLRDTTFQTTSWY